MIEAIYFNIKSMSYHLEDPYRYLPKCYPFIDSTRPYSAQYSSNRLTEKNRQIEGKIVQLKQEYLGQIHEENQNSEINLLRVRTLAQSLKKQVNEELSEARCEVYGARINKQANLRRNSHNFPAFVKHPHLLGCG